MKPTPRPCGERNNQYLPQECKKLCCLDCQFLSECVEKWKNGMGNVFCKVFKNNRWCSAVVRAVKNNPNLLKSSPIKINPSRRDDGNVKEKYR